MLSVVNDDGTTANGSSLIDEIIREGARRMLAAELEAFLGPDLRVQMETVERIPREPSGKRLLVKSRLGTA